MFPATLCDVLLKNCEGVPTVHYAQGGEVGVHCAVDTQAGGASLMHHRCAQPKSTTTDQLTNANTESLKLNLCKLKLKKKKI